MQCARTHLPTQCAFRPVAVVLVFAGVKEKNLKRGTDAYLDAINDFFGDNVDGEMGFDEIVGTINLLKKNKPNYLNKLYM